MIIVKDTTLSRFIKELTPRVIYCTRKSDALKFNNIKEASNSIDENTTCISIGHTYRFIEIGDEKLNNKVDNINDNVNHPNHYTNKKFECIDIIKEIVKDKPSEIAFQLGNSIKYIYRAGSKQGDESIGQTIHQKLIEDLEKSQWYLNNAIETLKDKDN